jgi:2-keto-4-pentenoate hydratase/2-oxohepta-3-ene-1,7-dioic acid hydratase in catechol pathway
MRWATYTSSRDGTQHAAVLIEENLYALPAGTSLLDLLTTGHEALSAAAAQARANPFEVLSLSDAPMAAPIPVPPSLRDFMAFEAHVVDSMAALGAQVDPVWYQQPAFYFTNPAAVLGPTDPNPIAPGSTQWDYELEVAAIIGTPGKDLDPATAESHIAGFTILCDWSARDLQATEMAVNLGPAKGKDTATSLGPLLVTPDELEPFRHGNGYRLAMTAAVNGTPYSSGTWADLHWSFGQMLAYASRGTELRAGDVIGSGTVGTGCILELSRVRGIENYPWLQPGDIVELTVEHLGTITSTVTAGTQPIPLS